LDAEPDLPDIREDDPRWVRCAVYTRQSVRRAGDDPAVTSCALQRTLCTEFIRNKTWEFWYPVMSPAMSVALTSKLVMRLQRKPNAVPRFYRCRTNGCAGQLPALEAEHMVRDALEHPPERWSAEDKIKLATYATSFNLMSPINQKRVFGACCVAVVWNRKRDGLDIELIPHSVLDGDDEEAKGSFAP